MFNWYSLPTFGAMLLFWLLASYVLTRSPRSLVSLTASSAQFAAAAYLLGQGMQANAPTPEAWRPWARDLFWGATLAPTLWYWLTVFLLREQETVAAQRYLRGIGYPLGVLFTVGSVVLTVGIYVDDWLQQWSMPAHLPPERATYFRYQAGPGPLYPGLVTLVLGTTLGAALNLGLGWCIVPAGERRPRFVWLLLSALLFIPAANSLTVANWLSLSFWPFWLSHLALGVAIAIMALNVAAYSLVSRVQLIRTDLLYFLTVLGVICVIYTLAFVLTGQEYSFQLLALLMITLILVILSHALLDVGRRALDRLFFQPEVQRLRSNLGASAQSAALTPNLDAVVSEVQAGLNKVSTEHLVRLTEEALRRLNNPSALAQCGLITRLPRTLAAVRTRQGDTMLVKATPLAQAQALREVLVSAIERLKPPDGGSGFDAPGALQYNILREEYLQGMPNKQIMVRHSISESTFHRNRREAISILARELGEQEARLSQA